jgi:hypothetical protein
VPSTVDFVPTFSDDVINAVLAHMNGDHLDDNLLIARAFGDLEAEDAAMTTLDENGGTWTYSIAGDTAEVTVPWTAPISERAEIRREVVVTYERACGILGVTPRGHE